jgi:glycogen debranching enzyme
VNKKDSTILHPSLVRLRPRNHLHYISHSRIVWATNRVGVAEGAPEEGLFFSDTRLLSHYKYFVNGIPPDPVALSAIDQQTWMGYYIFFAPGHPEGIPDSGSGMIPKASEQTVEMRVLRKVLGKVTEQIEFTNHTQVSTHFTFEIELESDFADLSETKQVRKQKGKTSKKFLSGEHFTYDVEYRASHKGRSIQRGFRLSGDFPTRTTFRKNRICTGVSLEPHGAWIGLIEWIPQIELPELNLLDLSEVDRRTQSFFKRSTSFRTLESETLAPIVIGALNQAKSDLHALRLFDLDTGKTEWTVAAGLPIYIALFGRDALTASWQAAMLAPDMMRGSLKQLSLWQGKRVDHWRDEEPGKMLHEAHIGPLEMLDYNPRRRYYGSVTTSGFYPFVLSELWHWTGDRAAVKALVEPALRSLEWLEKYSDLDGDGFFEYQTRSSQGVKNQAWKDSGDSIVYEDGSQVEPPIATCEEQAFVYVARLHLSEVLWWLGQKELAKKLFREADELKKRFNEVFWMEDQDFLALGLDSQKRPIRSITSNPGHCIAAGIVEQSLIPRISQRLLKCDLFSGWGVRTLSDQNPAYNPFSYHRGSVWPVEQGSFALGLMRYGMHDQVETICRAQFEVAGLFEYLRLPELFSGHRRDPEHPFPAFYPDANSPQAWSASMIFILLQSMLGLYPYAPLKLLLVDPHLPEWLPEITLENLHVGRAIASVKFFRKENGDSSFTVLDIQGKLHVIGQPSPWSLTATFGERLKDLLVSYV